MPNANSSKVRIQVNLAPSTFKDLTSFINTTFGDNERVRSSIIDKAIREYLTKQKRRKLLC